MQQTESEDPREEAQQASNEEETWQTATEEAAQQAAGEEETWQSAAEEEAQQTPNEKEAWQAAGEEGSQQAPYEAVVDEDEQAQAGDGKNKRSHKWLHSSRVAAVAVRVAYALVFIFNVQCALSFMIQPEAHVAAFELAGAPGAAAIRGLGIAFLMWNVTYPAVIVSPRRFRVLSIVVLIQQVVGLVGESWILATIPSGYETLAGSIGRFIAFDAIGLVLMAATLIWFYVSRRHQS